MMQYRKVLSGYAVIQDVFLSDRLNLALNPDGALSARPYEIVASIGDRRPHTCAMKPHICGEKNRRQFMSYFSSIGLSSSLLPGILWAQLAQGQISTITTTAIREASSIAGLDFTDQELNVMVHEINQNLHRYQELRKIDLGNSTAPPLYFNPLVPGTNVNRIKKRLSVSKTPSIGRPRNLEDVAFWPVTRLARLITSRQVKSTELAEMYLERLKRYNPQLNCVVTLTEDLALNQAKQLDKEIESGHYRGLLHGIPWGVKDLFATKRYPTTWGVALYKDRVIEMDATVVERLHRAGAVLIAKLATGELALGDVWFGGQTRNPWKLSEGSGGSSAGPAAAVAAGLVAFAIGTETRGSILEPAIRCGVTGFKPTFGRVSRHGVMALNWSLDKVGTLTRAVEDSAVVLSAICGPDGHDLAVTDLPFNWDAYANVKKLHVGFVRRFFSDSTNDRLGMNDYAALEKLRQLGIPVLAIDIPKHPAADIIEVIRADDAAAFDELTRSNQDESLISQTPTSRPNAFRVARAIPAVEYLQAQRARTKLMEDMAGLMSGIDVYIDSAGDSDNASINNLTGQPVITVPHGLTDNGTPTNFVMVGRPYGEAELLAVAKAYQDSTEWHLKHPNL